MNIQFLEVNKEDEKQFFSYETLFELFDEEKSQGILKNWYENKYKLVCTCSNKHKIDMVVRHGTKGNSDKYILATSKKQKMNHSDICNYSGGQYSSLYSSNWIENEDKTISINLLKNDYMVSKEIHSAVDGKDKDKKYCNINEDISVNKDKLTIYALGKRLLIQSWDELILFKGKKKYPNIKDLMNKVHSLSKRIKLSKKLTLFDIFYISGSLGRTYYIEKDCKRYTYIMMVFKETEVIDSDFVKVSLLNPLNNSIINIKAKKSDMHSAINSTNVKDGPYIVAGFIMNQGYDQTPLFKNFALIPINDFGVVIESSYERTLYNMLCKEKRLVQRLYDTKYHPKFEGMLPDGLLLDTTPKTILEVFGMSESDERYHLRKEQKTKHFSTLRETYFLWIWNAYLNETIPVLPARNLTE